MFKTLLLVKCDPSLYNLIENRALEIGITVSEYLKYLVAKDLEEATIYQFSKLHNK